MIAPTKGQVLARVHRDHDRYGHQRHIDPKLYLLFLQHNLHQTYAEQFLSAEQYQNSVVDTQEHIQKVLAYLREDY